ncbi:MAG TPA: hypothetical protein VFW47_01420 [Phenylobacterium sp.]|nr:hypothetical protein [Phenylobacterium sp.]
MKMHLLAACAAASLIVTPALAQTTAAAAPPAMTAPATPSSTMPATAMPAAETGTAANTAATADDLKIGAAISDSTGAELGTISKVTRGKTSADTMVTLKAGAKSKTIPASSLSLSGGVLTSSQAKADIWGPH